MSRQYAINGLPGLKGGVVTHVDGEIVPPGDRLPAGTTSFDITYWYYPTVADIAAGATPGKRVNIVIEDVPVSASDREVRNAIMQQRANVRNSKSWGYPEAVAYSTV